MLTQMLVARDERRRLKDEEDKVEEMMYWSRERDLSKTWNDAVQATVVAGRERTKHRIIRGAEYSDAVRCISKLE